MRWMYDKILASGIHVGLRTVSLLMILSGLPKVDHALPTGDLQRQAAFKSVLVLWIALWITGPTALIATLLPLMT